MLPSLLKCYKTRYCIKKDPLNPPLRDMSLRFLVAGLSGKVAGYLPKNRPIFVLFNLFSKLVYLGNNTALPLSCEPRLHFCYVSWRAKSSLCRQPFNFLLCMHEILKLNLQAKFAHVIVRSASCKESHVRYPRASGF